MRSITTEIHIAASPERVWEILSDLSRWHEWNPFIREAEGEASVGSRLKLRMFPAGGKPMTFRPTVRAAEPARELRWLGRLVMPGVFDGEHAFQLEAADGGTRLTQAETFTGILVPLLASTFTRTETSFGELNRALKARAEQTG